jgi:hypothetical protein
VPGVGDAVKSCNATGTAADPWHGELRQTSVWTLKYSVRGRKKPLHVSAKTSDWQKALAFKKKKFREVLGGEAPWEDRAHTTLEQVLDLVIAHYIKNKKRSLKRQELAKRNILEFPPFLRGAIAAAFVSSTMVNDDFVTFRQGQGAANGTINRELAMLRQGYKIAHRRIDAQGRPVVDRLPGIELLDEPKPRDVTIEQPQYEAIHTYLLRESPDIADLVEMYRLTGWRNKEPRDLDRTDVNWFAKTIRLRSVITKSGEPFELPFGDDADLHALLRRRERLAEDVERATGRPVQWLFFRRGRGGRIGKRTSKSSGQRISAFYKDWDAALRAAGLPDKGPRKKRPHDFRRVAAEETLDAEADLQTAANTVGWNSIASLLRYFRGNKKAVARAVKARAELREEKKAAAQLALRFGRGGKDEG